MKCNFVTILFTILVTVSAVMSWRPVNLPAGYKEQVIVGRRASNNDNAKWQITQSNQGARYGVSGDHAYVPTHMTMKVPKTVDTYSQPIGAMMRVRDDPDAVLDRGLLVSRKSIQQWLREEGGRAQNPSPSASNIHYLRYAPISPYIFAV